MKDGMKGIRNAGSLSFQLNNTTFSMPLFEGTEHERALDISRLRSQTGLITLDPGFVNTGSCYSAITYLDGDKGILRYRGIPIEELARKSTFVETAYLLIYGDLPTPRKFKKFQDDLTHHSMIHEDMKRFFTGYPTTAHPMSILSAMVCSLSSFYPEIQVRSREDMDLHIARLLSKVCTIAAFSHKKTVGHPFIGPVNALPYVENFLNMMFAVPAEPYRVNPDAARALDLIFILHADHEQNCSTSTVRIVGSSLANLYASVSAGICALWGPRHGGANQAVIEMLEEIQSQGMSPRKFIAKVKEKTSGMRLMGFGHRVYKNFDPRAKIIKATCDKLLKKLKVTDPLLDTAKGIEEAALKDDYFLERKLYPNVDFYSGIILRAIGIPIRMFPVIFAIGRMPGWIAHWKEMIESPDLKLYRPRQIYTGPRKRPYIPLAKRR